MSFGAVGRWVPDGGRHEGVSRISLCSKAQRPTGFASLNTELRRSVTVDRAVNEFGFDGMKNTLL